MSLPRLRLRMMMVAVAIFAILLGWVMDCKRRRNTVHAPDIIVVEVREALPTRPITGRHFVRPGGKVSLGYYGEIHVEGLTVPLAKAKIIRHLQDRLSDEQLGLIESVVNQDGTRTVRRVDATQSAQVSVYINKKNARWAPWFIERIVDSILVPE